MLIKLGHIIGYNLLGCCPASVMINYTYIVHSVELLLLLSSLSWATTSNTTGVRLHELAGTYAQSAQSSTIRSCFASHKSTTTNRVSSRFICCVRQTQMNNTWEEVLVEPQYDRWLGYAHVGLGFGWSVGWFAGWQKIGCIHLQPRPRACSLWNGLKWNKWGPKMLAKKTTHTTIAIYLPATRLN